MCFWITQWKPWSDSFPAQSPITHKQCHLRTSFTPLLRRSKNDITFCSSHVQSNNSLRLHEASLLHPDTRPVTQRNHCVSNVGRSRILQQLSAWKWNLDLKFYNDRTTPEVFLPNSRALNLILFSFSVVIIIYSHFQVWTNGLIRTFFTNFLE